MRVSLLTHTPDPERCVAAAARLCYSDATIGELMERAVAERAAFLRKILSLGHLSVLEHASFTFGIEGISRACSHQLVRHRIASFSQQSQRYVSHRERFAAVTPPSIAQRPELLARYEALLGSIHQAYQEFLDAGIAAEDARFVLPNAAATQLVMTMNARELRHFFALRCCRRAQWEIREMAVEMLRLCRQAAPLLFADAGPGCLAGHCPEGPMSCGEMAQVREEFSKL
ncbi:FAD-dependent thymidylate synthase [Geoalkalibacter halelectricus]|uniref:Flavin-dependent thymidylate synthase n=1 Tax=Geoalkalibacter halelectricus TaxID=2847045 RepID=A0ABY5ZQT0_9BACT|nr:FAD-dependent thymidylate synthase [Geoalkalibacter halelectricus]MDO3377664.1 FAD-dependent thymidylate synthase [Geoalkalibacter halelectricus]UWZ81453.1 FAD-dependent thymidylate synthase [Geoalkalibacter halelectricus]